MTAVYRYKPVLYEPTGPLASHKTHFVHEIIMGRILRHKDKSEFVRLSSTALQDVIGERNYGPTKRELLREGVVECNGVWSRRNHQCLGYRLNFPYSISKWHAVKITDQAVADRIRRAREEYKEPTKRVERHLYRMLRKVKISCPASVYEADPAYFVMYDMIRRRDFRWTRDEYGRIHTNLTNLWKGLRPHLTYQGKTLVNVDISNSQPLFFGHTLLTMLKNATFTENLSISTTNQEETRPGKPSTTICYDTECHKFLEIVQNQGIYEYLMPRMGSKKLARSTVKKRFFAWLYGSGSFHGRPYDSAISKVMKKEFPPVCECVDLIKRPGHQQLPRLMQKVESDFVIGTVCGRLMREYPDLFIATIHDSVLTTLGNEQIVEQVMLEEFEKIGLRPNLTVDYLGHQPRIAGVDETDGKHRTKRLAPKSPILGKTDGQEARNKYDQHESRPISHPPVAAKNMRRIYDSQTQ